MLAQLMLKHHSLPNLEQLNLKACRITPEGMTALAEGLLVKRKIKKLDLRCVVVPRIFEVMAIFNLLSTQTKTNLCGKLGVRGGYFCYQPPPPSCS